MQEMNAALMDTIATCGDVNRNVMAMLEPDRIACACRSRRMGASIVGASASEDACLLRDLPERREA
jgi:sulfite reductase beta subunit-like hemoprotein